MIPKLVLFFNIFLGVAAQYSLKLGVLKIDIPFNLTNLPKILFSPLVFLGFFLYGVSSILWIYILKNLPLSVAYPTLSIGYILVLFVSWKFLGESVGPINIVGVILIISGVGLLFLK